MTVKILLLLLQIQVAYPWDPDAGLVTSWTKLNGVSVNATSNVSPPSRAIDNDDNTNWVSGSYLPSHYIPRPESNVLKGICGRGKCSGSSIHGDIASVTDGSLSSTATFGTQHGKSVFMMSFYTPITVKLITIWGKYDKDTDLIAYDNNGHDYHLKLLTPKDNYRDVTVEGITYTVSRITVESTANFFIKEIGALGPNGFIEDITVNLGTMREVATIRTRHWAGTGNAQALSLLVSSNGNNWNTISPLDPDALHAVVTRIDPPQKVQYIKLQYSVTPVKYRKVYCFEIDAWDAKSKWGDKPPVIPQSKTVREILGVNGIWGWGHNKYSSMLKSTEGPGLYNSVASGARNYHNLDWDVLDPDNDPEFTAMASGGGTNAKSWLNWDTEYQVWKNASLSVDASVQFTAKSFAESAWNTPEQSAFNYGKAFAQHFGPIHGNGLVHAMEVGNEPWDYDAAFYRQILKGMSAGAKSVDNSLVILPGAFQAHEKHDTGNYIGTRLTQDIATNISAINFHTYSYRQSSQGVRTGTFPEHPDSTFNSMNNIVKWRNTNMPSSPIWVTEWGWDSPGGGDQCTFPECVSEQGQGVYAIRGLLILMRGSAERVHWFFYADSDYCSTLYCRSGLTASGHHGFSKKASFLAFESFLSLLGNEYFHGVIKEDKDAYVYSFGKVRGGRPDNLEAVSHLVAWKPVSIDDSSTSTISITLPVGSSVTHEWTLTGSTHMLLNSNRASVNNRVLTITVSSKPLILKLHHINLGPVVGK
ncbi:hypothetical protein FSP39_004637 [Pinctada imbricata]|uniref:Uncharacterized protein n=1 Tax=Pinctada imbricata TaxID=66713 RepID=A0AA88YCX0_PINIB|nr:hypothetical protein FSP39_004637 [Pinctada imbricata]